MNRWTYLFSVTVLTCYYTNSVTSSPQFGGLPCSGGGCGGQIAQTAPYIPDPNWGVSSCSGGGCGGQVINTGPLIRPPNWGGTSCSGGACGGQVTVVRPPNWGGSPCSGGGCGGQVTQNWGGGSPCSGGGCGGQVTQNWGGGSPCSGGSCGGQVTQVRPPNWGGASCSGGGCGGNGRYVEEGQNNCCYVTHPRTCYTEEETGNKRCFTRRHRECSDFCSSSAVAIQEREGSYQGGCQYIRNYPYVYCGNYERLNCGSCYTCDGKYNPSECSKRSECSEGCRRSGLVY